MSNQHVIFQRMRSYLSLGLTRRLLLLTVCVLCALSLCGVRTAHADDAGRPFLHELFTDNMVLQRNMLIPVWGWTDPGKKVTVSLNGKTAIAEAGPDGKWMARVGPFPAGGPYTLTVTGPQTVSLKNVLIGDVWICSGQSNMEMGIGNVNNAQQEIASADYPLIRLYTVPKKVAYTPESTLNSQWLICTPDNVKSGGWNGFSAAGYFFGRKLYEDLKVPIGLIHTSWGGTIAEAWTSAEALKGMDDFRSAVDSLPSNVASGNVKPNDPNVVTVLYNGMIAPLVPFGIKGAIWYQGESNAGRAKQYQTLLPTMIKDWRARFEVGDFPFLIVQLANFQAVQQAPSEGGWAELREAQFLTAERLPKTAIAVATDIGDDKDIHPKNKQEVGRRLALDAEAIAYGRKVEYSGPRYKGMAVKGNKIVLTFDHTSGGLVAKGGDTLKGFAIAGEDKKFVWADAKIVGKTIEVSAAGVDHPVAVRYNWANNPIGNLYNGDGLPASSFRTDYDMAPLK